jgi:F0F1-type ATP synthase assembly protein I
MASAKKELTEYTNEELAAKKKSFAIILAVIGALVGAFIGYFGVRVFMGKFDSGNIPLIIGAMVVLIGGAVPSFIRARAIVKEEKRRAAQA